LASDISYGEVDVTAKTIESGLGSGKDLVADDIYILFVKALKADVGSNEVGLKGSDLLDEELVVWEAIKVSYENMRDK
jgi:hypothetical protein